MEMTRQKFLARIDQLLDILYMRLTAKNDDYAGENDPFANFKEAAEFASFLLPPGIPEKTLILHGIFTRMGDKKGRLHQLLVSEKDPKVQDESVVDTLLDWIGYLLIVVAYIESMEVVEIEAELVEEVEEEEFKTKEEQARLDWFHKIFKGGPVTTSNTGK